MIAFIPALLAFSLRMVSPAAYQRHVRMPLGSDIYWVEIEYILTILNMFFFVLGWGPDGLWRIIGDMLSFVICLLLVQFGEPSTEVTNVIHQYILNQTRGGNSVEYRNFGDR
jgi:hypothetical protein